MMKKTNWILALCCSGLMLGVVLNSGGCSGDNSPAAIQTQGTLHGDWGGVHTDSISDKKVKFAGKINHEQGSRNFSGLLTLDGEQYSIAGVMENNAVHFTADNPKWTITYDGKYTGGRMNGTFVRAGSSLATASLTPGEKLALTTSGTYGAITFLNIPDTIAMGPWLLYSQDNTKSVSNMTVRVGLNNKNLAADVTATDNTNGIIGKVYGPVQMVKTSTYTYSDTTVADQNWVGIFQYTFSGLPSNRSFSYTVNIYDDKGKNSSVTASFSTPPSWKDIDNKVVSNQVFYSFGDNRRYWGGEANNLPYVEENLVVNTDLANHASSQSFLSHNGDATTLGQHIDLDTVVSGWRHAGWKAEWLNSSNDSDVTVGTLNFDARFHTWLRASVPTFMSAGNHEGKDTIGEGSFKPQSFNMYGSLMAGIYNNSVDDNIKLQYDGASYDTFTYMADHGGIRNIVLNTYNCYSRADAQAILGRIKTWIDGAYAGGPVVLSLHPTIFVDSDEVGAANCWNTAAQIKADIQPLIVNKKNVIVIMGHVHETARTWDKDVNYYILGTGGAPDMAANKNTSWMVDFYNKDIGKPPYLDFAYGQFSVDYSARQITVEIFGMGGKRIDLNYWNY